MQKIDIDKAELIEMREAGSSLEMIALNFGCSKQAISAFIKRHKLPRKSDPRGPIDVDLFRKLWDAGAGTTEIGKAIKRAPQHVIGYAAQHGFTPRKKHARLQRVAAPVAPVVREPKPDPCAHLQGLDREIALSGGRYADLTAIAADHGITYTKALQRWHVLRVQK